MRSALYDVLIEIPEDVLEGMADASSRLALVRREMERALGGLVSRVCLAGGEAELLAGTMQLIVRSPEEAWEGVLAAGVAGHPLLRPVGDGVAGVPQEEG